MTARAARSPVWPGPAALLIAAGAALAAGQAPSVQSPAVATGAAVAHHVDRARLMAVVTRLASEEFQGRGAGSPGGMKARQWIVGQFQGIGLRPVGFNGFLQPFTFVSRDGSAAGQPVQISRDGANILGLEPGTAVGGTCIVVSAHYDHLGVRDGAIYYGADDNASGVAVLLEVARWFAAHPPRHRLLFAAFDAEEQDLEGARTFVRSTLAPLKTIAIDVNLDMVSRNDRNEIYAAGTFQSPWLIPILGGVQQRAAVKIMLGHDRPPREAGGLDDWTQQSDHGAFHDAGLPFLYFGVEDHADYHKPTDTADKINPAFFGDAADMIVEAVAMLDLRMP
jgi:hypothetical protein